MNPIDALFHSRRAAVRKVFVPFIPAGDPDLDTTARLLPALADAGAGLIEIGFPFSDPIADGPVIQAAYTRALNRGIKLEQIFDTVRRAAGDPALAPRPAGRHGVVQPGPSAAGRSGSSIRRRRPGSAA